MQRDGLEQRTEPGHSAGCPEPLPALPAARCAGKSLASTGTLASRLPPSPAGFVPRHLWNLGAAEATISSSYISSALFSRLLVPLECPQRCRGSIPLAFRPCRFSTRRPRPIRLTSRGTGLAFSSRLRLCSHCSAQSSARTHPSVPWLLPCSAAAQPPRLIGARGRSSRATLSAETSPCSPRTARLLDKSCQQPLPGSAVVVPLPWARTAEERSAARAPAVLQGGSHRSNQQWGLTRSRLAKVSRLPRPARNVTSPRTAQPRSTASDCADPRCHPNAFIISSWSQGFCWILSSIVWDTFVF